jgi:hypothetical protein
MLKKGLQSGPAHVLRASPGLVASYLHVYMYVYNKSTTSLTKSYRGVNRA